MYYYNGEVDASSYISETGISRANVQRHDRYVGISNEEWRLKSRRCTTARDMLLYFRKTDISPMYKGEVDASVYEEEWNLADVLRRGNCFCLWELEISLMFNGEIIKCDYISTLPLYIGEIPVSLINYIQTHLPRRCTSARFQSSVYEDTSTSPLIVGEISVLLIYRRIYLAVVEVHRRDFSVPYIRKYLPRRYTSAWYPSHLYTGASTSPLYIG